MVKIKTIDLFGAEILANDLADIVWQGMNVMKDEARSPTISEERKRFLEYRINQAVKVHFALLENGITEE